MTPQQARKTSPYLINESALLILPTLACVFGTDEAIFIQQVQYWLKTSKHEYEGRVWIYNKLPEWLEQMPFFTRRTLQRIIATLKEAGVLLVTDEWNKSASDRTSWYTIDYDTLDARVDAYLQAKEKGSAKMAHGSAKMAHPDAKMAHPGAKMAHSINKEADTTTDTTTLADDATASGTAPLTAEPPPALPPTGDEYPSPETEAKKEEPPPKKPKLSEHPLSQAYHDYHNRWPTTGQMKQIIEMNPPLDKWIRAIREWDGRGYRINDIKTQLEWAMNPALMERRAPGKGKSIQTTDAEPVDEELMRQAREDVANWQQDEYPQKE